MKTGEAGAVKTILEECTILVLAREGRHKFPSLIGMAREERHKSLLLLVLDVYITGSALSALPVTPSEGTLQKDSRLVEAYRVVLRGPEAVQLDIQCIQGVLAVHFSDFDLAHHAGRGRDLDLDLVQCRLLRC